MALLSDGTIVILSISISKSISKSTSSMSKSMPSSLPPLVVVMGNLVRGEELIRLEFFSDDVESTKTLNVEDIIKGLAH